MRKIIAAGRALMIKDCRGLSSVRGLMFDSLQDKDGALVSGNSIWTPFCRPLDLYFLDEKFVVMEKQPAVTLAPNPKTWKVYKHAKAKYCLELRRGAACLKKGERVKFL